MTRINTALAHWASPRAVRRGVIIAAAALAVILTASPARAADDSDYSRAYHACLKASGGVTAAMRNCSGTEHERLDTILNRRYQYLLRSLPASRAHNLRLAQRKWLVVRKRDCDAEAATEGGGTLALIIADGCYLDKLADRVKALQAMR
jgi:uncharacterized protein YecT (DUF1311 family)